MEDPLELNRSETNEQKPPLLANDPKILEVSQGNISSTSKWRSTVIITMLFAIFLLTFYISVHFYQESHYNGSTDHRDLVYLVEQAKKTAKSFPEGHMIIAYERKHHQSNPSLVPN
jgi:hypothetical protein